MSMDVETKDCTALSDAELSEMADICSAGPAGFEIGLLSKHRDLWVLITQVRDNGKLQGFGFCTLERIGGTPCVLVGLLSVKHSSKRDTVLRGLMTEAYHRALMAFPDEDVLVGTRLVSPSGFEAFRALADIVPRPDHKAVGEERAWGRRLAKRFGVDAGYDEQTFRVKGAGSIVSHMDHESLKPETIEPDVAAMFKGIKVNKGDCLIACGWAMTEDLLKLGKH